MEYYKDNKNNKNNENNKNNKNNKNNGIKLAPHLQVVKNETGACFKDYKRLCKPKILDPCKRNCCDLLKSRHGLAMQNRAAMSKMQAQLAAALKMEVPKYAKRSKPTPGKGPGCGCPPRRILPPLWMYSLDTQRPKPSIAPRAVVPKRHHNSNKYYHNYADEIGTHRYYLSS